ncbi:hypothetical protein [Culicoidibacter larvae]|uniref:Uncharacterized protein n=1 Tax=Culicoidibacter larvae TaxID=2579976 RepID=A0A5R8Q9I8_9FIRM|nr:hypothetical protein [Culicoidibacter larvae]TLG72576.1 hypothetical protein FEZ08_09315 [Culicoidibacter larvae]
MEQAEVFFRNNPSLFGIFPILGAIFLYISVWRDFKFLRTGRGGWIGKMIWTHLGYKAFYLVIATLLLIAGVIWIFIF